jgi:hypothetical protein
MQFLRQGLETKKYRIELLIFGRYVIFSTFLLSLIAMLLISQNTDLEAVARNVAQPAKQQISSSIADQVLVPLDPDAALLILWIPDSTFILRAFFRIFGTF